MPLRHSAMYNCIYLSGMKEGGQVLVDVPGLGELRQCLE